MSARRPAGLRSGLHGAAIRQGVLADIAWRLLHLSPLEIDQLDHHWCSLCGKPKKERIEGFAAAVAHLLNLPVPGPPGEGT